MKRESSTHLLITTIEPRRIPPPIYPSKEGIPVDTTCSPNCVAGKRPGILCLCGLVPGADRAGVAGFLIIIDPEFSMIRGIRRLQKRDWIEISDKDETRVSGFSFESRLCSKLDQKRELDSRFVAAPQV